MKTKEQQNEVFQARLHEIQQQIQQAQFSAAIDSAQHMLQQTATDSEYQQLLYLLGVAQRYAQQLPAALKTIKQLLDHNTDHARAYQEMGYIHMGLQQADRAIPSFRWATQLNPALIASWQQLAQLLQQQGQTEQSQQALQQYQFLQQLPPPLLGAQDLMYEGKLHKADQLCRHFLQQHKHHIEGMCLLAQIGIRLRIYDDAEFLLESCVELEPDHHRARSEYLGLLLRLGKFKPALDQAKMLLASQPDNPSYQMAMGNVQIGLGNIQAGIELFNQVLKQDPQRAGLQVQLGHAYKANGQVDLAVQTYQQAYQIKPAFGDAYWSLANTKTYRFSDAELAQMKQLEANPQTGLEDRIHLCFAVGKALEDRKDYPFSFEYYQRGNQLKSQQSGYSADKTEMQIDAQIKHCTAELFQQRGHLGLDDPAPIFIVGLPRAGSTLLEQILASHSMVDGTMELHNILGLALRLRGRTAAEQARYPGNLWELEESYFKRFGQQYINDTQVYREGAPLFIDKMPNNFMHIGLIKLILPKAKIIDARRHPMSCCFSGYKQLFGEGQDFSYDLDDIGRYYQSYIKLMEHWDKVLPGFVLRVQHEEVVHDLEGQVRRMLDFCGLPFEQNCIDFHQTRRNIKTPSSEQVRQPIYTSALEQWKHYADDLKPLTIRFHDCR
ncbi:tetratricopeptide repeat-containing sulfotransferase family protein [Neptunicella sp. SCSIO 80796]|uniref:tetratricopeptide repeat-containing sulfotransferase family protein n=1 Tax=Neptunicella plasticusilytica TaxID=3117012 RepID=UPI003A4D8BD6